MSAAEKVAPAGALRGGTSAPEFERSVRFLGLHALGWLLAGNVVGLWLAVLLIAPGLGALAGPLTYGRWMPVHLDLQLYGWCALPLVGLLLWHFLPRRAPSAGHRLARLAVAAWSAVLAFAAVSFLAGETSGKVFLEWSGPSRVAWAAQLVLLAVALGAGLLARRRLGEIRGVALWLRAAVLVGLLAIPYGLYVGSGPSGSHPPINPETGGTTGTSVYGATLGTAVLFCVLPLLIGVGRKREARRRGDLATATFFSLATLFFLFLDHGDVSRRDPMQLVAIFSLALFPPVVTLFLRRFDFDRASRRWLLAAGAWGGLLVSTGILTYLPGILQRWKFTNALVGHVHLAMAGLLSSLCMVILCSTGTAGLPALLAESRSFWLWQLGCGVMVAALLALGTLEAVDPEVIFRRDLLVDSLYALRLAAGAAMTLASWRWWRGLLGISARVESGLESKLTREITPDIQRARDAAPAVAAWGGRS